MILKAGTIIGSRYEILEKIGAGGMALVYRAKDTKLERYVTVKVLRHEFVTDEEFKARFKIEARSAASLSHPNIVNVYDVGEDGDIYFIVMEYVHGDTLKKAIIEKAPFDTKSTINVAIQMASALSHAHKNHIVHRDIKPQNILVATDGMIKVTDFGIARAVTAATVTTTANAIGSVHYFSPEQARGGYVDEKSDIYSLGITMFEMITGVLPYEGENSVAIALKHINEELPDIREHNPNVSRSLEGIIKKATRKKTDERYASIDLLLADLIKARSDSSGSFIEEEIPNSTAAPTVEITQKELQYIQNTRAKKVTESTSEVMGRSARRAMREKEIEKKEIEDIPEPDRSGRRLKISKNDDYEEGYEQEYWEEPKKVGKTPARKEVKREYDEYDDEYDRRQEKKVIIAAVITAVVIIVIISFIGIKFFGGSNDSPSKTQANVEEGTITVPSFEGITLEQAQKRAEELGLKVMKNGEEVSKIYEAGLIVFQSLSEGEKVNKDTEISVKISTGLSFSTMPDLKDKDEKEASSMIYDMIGKNPEIKYENNDEIKVGTIIKQEPSEGTKITSDSKIVLTISKGEELKKVIVPNIEGKTLEQAKKELEREGLVVGNVTEIESAKVKKGVIITQTVNAGEEVVKNSVVNLVVSKGKEETSPPEETEKPSTITPEKTENSDIKPKPNDTSSKPSDTPEQNNKPNTEPVTPPEASSSSTKVFAVVAPIGTSDTTVMHIKVLKTDSNGVMTTVLDTQKPASELPLGVTVTGTGTAEIQCFIDDVQQWSEKVDFSEGGN